MTCWRIQAAALVALAAAGGAAAQETLERAWQKALMQDRALAAVAEDLEAARATERAARAQRWPSLGVSGSYTQLANAPALAVTTPAFSFQSPRLFDNDDFVMGAAEVTLPLYAGGSIAAGIRAARGAREGAEADHERATIDLKLEVAQRYVDVLRTRAAVTAAQAQVAALEAHVRDVGVMVETGAVHRNDLLASRVALANAQQQRLRTESAAAQARAAYNRRVGEPLEREPDLAAALQERMDIPTEPLATLQDRALAQRSELRALDARARALAAQARAEQGRRLPQVGLTAGYQHLESTVLDREDFTLVGVGVRWQLFDGGQARQRAASLRRASRATELRREDFAADIRIEVQQSWLAVAEADARAAASRDAEAQAEENLRMSREQYSAELIANTQVLEAVALRASAAANTRDATLDAALARLRLRGALGEL